MFEKRISIFTGHFGSGKTEVAVNYSLKLSEICSKTAVVDLDIVNPYFRTADVKQLLESRGLRVFTTLYANTNVDVPALPSEINSLFEKQDYRVVLDVGGDDLGARALSRYKDEFNHCNYEMFLVINTKRPMTDTAEKIEAMIRDIEYRSRLPVTKLVNNTNLLGNTAIEDLLEGNRIIEEVSKKMDKPLGFISCFREYAEAVGRQTGMEVLELDKYIKLPWD